MASDKQRPKPCPECAATLFCFTGVKASVKICPECSRVIVVNVQISVSSGRWNWMGVLPEQFPAANDILRCCRTGVGIKHSSCGYTNYGSVCSVCCRKETGQDYE
jgi:hypothetical protein